MTSSHLASLCWYQAPMIRFYYYWGSCMFVDVGRSLWQEDGSVVCNCCWASPALSFSGLSRRTRDHFYYLKFETPLIWRTRSLYLYPPGRGRPSYIPGTEFHPLHSLIHMSSYQSQSMLQLTVSRPGFFITIRQLWACCVTPSLMRGQVCSLQLLLGLTSAVILDFKSHGNHDHVLLA
jgi:hypothetical protein